MGVTGDSRHANTNSPCPQRRSFSRSLLCVEILKQPALVICGSLPIDFLAADIDGQRVCARPTVNLFVRVY